MRLADQTGGVRAVVTRWWGRVAFALALVSIAASASAQESDVPRAVLDRFVAPCCWVEGLATHDSPLARALRDEIAARLRAGETVDAIERDLVARHGERVLAAPRALEETSGMLFALLFGALFVLVVSAMRRRSGSDAAPPSQPEEDDPELERRLQQELERQG